MKIINSSNALGFITAIAISALAATASATPSQPMPKKTVAPRLTTDIRDASGEVKVLVNINEYGFVTDAHVANSTNPALNSSALNAALEWTFEPAMEDGHAVPSKAVQPFNFNQGSIVLAEKQPQDTLPKAKTKTSPELTKDLLAITGEVVLLANIDALGAVQGIEVKRSTHAELESPATAALARWTFKPAVKDGQAVASKVIIPFLFEGEAEAKAIASRAPDAKSLDTAPVALRQPTPDLPAALVKERGEAKLKLTIDENGFVADAEVIESSNESLTAAAREAALQWKFKPAIKDGVAVASKVVQPFSFNGGLLMADLPVDRMPSVKTSKAPELPKALVGVQGYVKVRLNLDSKGNVISASSAKTSHDELVEPTLLAAREWKFKPAVRDGEEVSSSVIVPFVFNQES